MKFYKVVLHDIINGTMHRKGMFLTLAVFLVEALYAGAFLGIAMDAIEGLSVSSADYFVFLFSGCAPLDLVSNLFGFQLPVLWIAIFAASALAVFLYPTQDLERYGEQVMLRINSRSLWWFSKVIWVVLTTMIQFLLGFMVVCVVCVWNGNALSLNNTPVLTPALFREIPYFSKEISYTPVEFIGRFCCMTICVAVTLNLIQLLLSFVLHPIAGFLVSLSILTLSAVHTSPILVGNYAMAMRTSDVIQNGVVPGHGAAVCAAICCIVIISGNAYFTGCDILGGKEAEL